MEETTEVKKVIPGHQIIPEPQNITREKLESFIPKGSATQVTDNVLEIINSIEDDTGLSQEYTEERLLSNMHLLGNKGTSIEKLVNATKYCCLQQHYTNEKAWEIVFPEKYKKLKDRDGFIASHVAQYNKTELVVAISTAMLVHASIGYQRIHHASIMKQVDLMNGIAAGYADGSENNQVVSAHVQHLAAKTLEEITRMPEDNTIELKIGSSDAVLAQQQEFNDHLGQLVAQQQERFRQGGSIQAVQQMHIKKVEDTSDTSDVIDGEVE